jgi:hypothetical protein
MQCSMLRVHYVVKLWVMQVRYFAMVATGVSILGVSSHLGQRFPAVNGIVIHPFFDKAVSRVDELQAEGPRCLTMSMTLILTMPCWTMSEKISIRSFLKAFQDGRPKMFNGELLYAINIHDYPTGYLCLKR